jgi:hypothetical protein
MTQAMARHDTGEALVIPIIARPVDWNNAPFGRLKALPKDGRPLTSWPNRDGAFLDVARGVRDVAENLRSRFTGQVSVRDTLVAPAHLYTAQIQLTIDDDLDTFNANKQNDLLNALQSLIIADYTIRIKDIESGSIKLTIGVSREQAEQLLWLYRRGVLDELKIQDAKLLSDSAAAAIIEDKIINQAFDVFLCHNSEDKNETKKIGIELRKRGVLPWLDEWELRPGLPWQRALEVQIESIRSAAVFVGTNGFGPWQNLELDAFIRQFIQRACPVIPVLLRACKRRPSHKAPRDGVARLWDKRAATLPLFAKALEGSICMNWK